MANRSRLTLARLSLETFEVGPARLGDQSDPPMCRKSKGVMVMATSTETRPQLDVQSGPDPARGRFLMLAVIVLGIAVVVLGAMALFGDSDSTEASQGAVSAEVEQLLDAYGAAWNDSDREAFLSLVSDDYVIESGRYGSFTGSAQATYLGSVPGWHSEPIGEPLMVGEGPWYVSTGNLITADQFPPEGVASISTFKIVEEGGVLKVAAHHPLGEYFDQQ